MLQNSKGEKYIHIKIIILYTLLSYSQLIKKNAISKQEILSGDTNHL